MASENVKDDSSDFEVPDFYDEPLLSELELTPLKKGLDLSQNANSTKSCTLPPLDEISEKQNIDSAKDHDLSNILNNNQDLEKFDEADESEDSLDYLLFEDHDESEPERIEPSGNSDERNALPIIEDTQLEDSNESNDEDELLKLLKDFDTDDEDSEPDDSDGLEIYDDESLEPQNDSVEEPHELVNSSTEDNSDDELLSLLDDFDEDDEIESGDSSDEDSNQNDTSDESPEIEAGEDNELSEDELLAMLSDLEDEDNEDNSEDSEDDDADELLKDQDDEDEDDDSDELSEDELLSMLSDLDDEENDSNNDDENSHGNEDQDIEYTEEDLMNLLQNLDNDSSNEENIPKNNNPYTDNDDSEEEVGDDDDLQNLLEDDFVPPENPFAKPDSEPRRNQNDENEDDLDEDNGKDKNSESLLKKIFYPYIWICEKIYKGIMFLLTSLGKIPLLGKIFKALKNLDQIWRIVSYILIPFLILIAFLMMRTPSGTMTDASVEFPDNGSVTMSDYVYIPETDEIQITLTNTGDVIALVKPTIIVDEKQKCSSPKEYLIKSGQEINAKIKCSIEGKNPSFSGLLEWEGN